LKQADWGRAWPGVAHLAGAFFVSRSARATESSKVAKTLGIGTVHRIKREMAVG
jgi:hypothetical protein